MTRRDSLLVLGAGAALSRSARAADFWNAKQPAEWSEKDIQRLMAHSPWAKEVTVEFRGRSAMPPPGAMPGGGGGGRRGGRGGGGTPNYDASSSAGMGGSPITAPSGGGRGMGGGGVDPTAGLSDAPGGSTPQLRATVRWESAKPIRDGRKRPIRPEDAPFYILSVGPLPRTPAAGDGAPPQGATPCVVEEYRKRNEQRLKEATRLERKGHDPIVPERAMLIEGNAARVLLFYFPRDPQPIEAHDKDVTFATAFGPMQVKAKFSLKDMEYHSQLEL